MIEQILGIPEVDCAVDAVGFEATLTGYSGALFASAGGYHHHVAMNVWNSAGAGPRAAIDPYDPDDSGYSDGFDDEVFT